MSERSRSNWRLLLTIVKYAITAIIGALGGGAAASCTGLGL